jgi:hypothetical protein
MDKMMRKRGIAIISVILGAIVILLVVYGIGNVGYQFAKEKIFGEKGVFARTPGQKEFVPYTGPPLTDEERKVLNSVHALRCALNSVALGEFKPNDPEVCPAPLVLAPTEIAATGKAWALVTGRVTEPKSYDTVSVQCDGVQAARVQVPALEAPALRTIAQEVLNCKAKALDNNLPLSTRCAHLSVLDWEGNSYDDDRLTRYMTENKMEFKGWEGAIDWLTSWDKVALQNRIEVETFNNKMEKRNQYDSMLCVDFVRGTVMNYISINGCDKDGVSEAFNCKVKSFELPQDVSNGFGSLFIQAFGDPRWLVYYESFPQEAAEYWHKDWRDLINLWTIGTVTASGVLNMVGAGKGAKAVQKVAQQQAKEIAKESAEALVKKGVTEAEKVIIERVAKSGAENTLKSLVVEESLQGIKGIGPKIAEEITSEVTKAVGAKTGSRAWRKAIENGLDKKIADIIEKKLTNVPEDYIQGKMAKVPITEFLGPGGRALSDAERDAVVAKFRSQFVKEYRDMVKKFVIEGGEIPEEALKEGAGKTVQIAGKEFRGGVKELFERDLGKELSKGIIKRRAYEQFMEKLITAEGKLNVEMFAESGEAAIKSLNAIASVSPTFAQSAWGGARQVLDTLLAGTTGGFTTRNFPKLWKPNELFGFIAAQSPIKLSGRGFIVGGTAVKTVAGLPNWVATHSYPSMLLIAWLIEAQDSVNEKFRPVGANSLAINQPTLLGPTLPLGLNDAVSNLHVTLKDTAGIDKYGQRMYFVSPCKANIRVSKGKCTCYKNPTLHKFTYPSGTINVEPGSVVPLPDDVLEKRFRERWATKAKAVMGENWRAQWNTLDDASKARYGNSYERYAEEQYLDMEFENYEIEYFNKVVSPVGGDVRGRGGVINWLAGTSTTFSGQAPSMVADTYSSNYDASNAVKRCDQQEYMKSAMTVFGGVLLYDTFISGWAGSGGVYSGSFDPEVEARLKRELLKDEYFKPACIEVEPERLDGTYCYDHFPKMAWLRTGLMIVSLAVDAAIIGFSGGLGIPLLLVSGAFFSAADIALEAFEKWP